ncbi:A-type ATP synthase subunit K [Halobacterium hubeiense]|jgi:V/A-type H+-transporting ATPase subunit K|uniref:A-type ATP synthase subunit K n=2 Tax=Halobacterium TaxID=2239 RepID=A0A0U5H9L1_9EURY|nr:ATP synthase subunit K [Halobacterium hubeiense]CQH61362.1 A-type ATP synthase subunit K [Halobacterium hubeiense]
MIETLPEFATIAQETAGSSPVITPQSAAALAVGLAALAAGYAERGIGSAAVGAIAEDQDLFGSGLILTVLPETLVILALVVVFVVPSAY